MNDHAADLPLFAHCAAHRDADGLLPADVCQHPAPMTWNAGPFVCSACPDCGTLLRGLPDSMKGVVSNRHPHRIRKA